MCDQCQMVDCPHYCPGGSCYYDGDDNFEGKGEFDFEDYKDTTNNKTELWW